jgi:PAS domain-containing protein
MAMHEHPHVELVMRLRDQFAQIMTESPQAIFIYLDDYHKLCNQRFAEMLGYRSPEEWSKMKTPVTDTTDDARDNLISAVMRALEGKVASSVQVSWRRKTGEIVRTNCITVPGFIGGQPYSMHFFSVVE